MLSLAIILAIIILQLLIQGAALAWSARAVGSPRAHFRTGIWVALALLVLGVGLTLVSVALPLVNNGLALGIGFALILVQVLVVLLLVSRLFRLSTARALAPVGAYMGMSVLCWIFVAMFIKPFVLEAFVIPTQSMAPTLSRDDRFVVNKLLAPRRWSLVAYQTSEPEPAISCKRLVGLPGESLRFENGTLYVDDEALTAPDGVAGRYSAEILDAPGLTRYRDGETIELAENEFFFVGDNVEQSRDSRTDGPTDVAKLVGVVDLLYWPPRRISLLP
jgi:signal peptidase I